MYCGVVAVTSKCKIMCIKHGMASPVKITNYRYIQSNLLCNVQLGGSLCSQITKT